MAASADTWPDRHAQRLGSLKGLFFWTGMPDPPSQAYDVQLAMGRSLVE